MAVDLDQIREQWRDRRRNRAMLRQKGVDPQLGSSQPTDPNGGFLPTNPETAKRVDLITLPEDVEGTNCGNCTFFAEDYCQNPDVDQAVTARQCCNEWTHEGMFRGWEAEEPESEKGDAEAEEEIIEQPDEELDYKAWEESEHPRADDGKFSSGGSGSGGSKKESRKPTSSAKPTFDPGEKRELWYASDHEPRELILPPAKDSESSDDRIVEVKPLDTDPGYSLVRDPETRRIFAVETAHLEELAEKYREYKERRADKEKREQDKYKKEAEKIRADLDTQKVKGIKQALTHTHLEQGLLLHMLTTPFPNSSRQPMSSEDAQKLLDQMVYVGEISEHRSGGKVWYDLPGRTEQRLQEALNRPRSEKSDTYQPTDEELDYKADEDARAKSYAEWRDRRKAGIWITIGGYEGDRGSHEGGTRVLIDDESGDILGGGVPKELHGTNVGDFKKLIEHHRKQQKEGRKNPENPTPNSQNHLTSPEKETKIDSGGGEKPKPEELNVTTQELPKLTGSDKQTEWAGRIRAESLRPGPFAEELSETAASHTDASWWISNRNTARIDLLDEALKPDTAGVKDGSGNAPPKQSRAAFYDIVSSPKPADFQLESRQARTGINNAMWGGLQPSLAADKFVAAGYSTDSVRAAMEFVAERLPDKTDDFTPEKIESLQIDVSSWLRRNGGAA